MAAIEQFYAELNRRIKDLEADAFKSPPADMLAYQQRRGSWVALTEMRDWMNERARKDPDDDDED